MKAGEGSDLIFSKINHMYIIDIPYRTPGGNELKGMESWRYKKVKNEIRILLNEYFTRNLPPTFTGKVKVCFTRYGKKSMDRDNLWFTPKPWLDILQEEFALQHPDPFVDKVIPRFIIEDDSSEYIDLTVNQVTGRHQPYKVVIRFID